jgi:hypothetical protein
MFARVVTFTIVASVIACPLSCGLGWCHGGACCAVSEQATPHCPNCAKAPRRDQSSTDQDRPLPMSDQSTCQGICGGAVFEKPCQLAQLDDSFFVPLVNTRDSASIEQAKVRPRETASVCLGASDNYGRIVRTLHESLLC